MITPLLIGFHAGSPEEHKKMTGDLIQVEYQKAKAEGRQPLCPYCRSPLEIFQLTQEANYWKWDPANRCYVKEESGGDIDKPYCVVCKTREWAFVDDDLVVY